MVVGEATRHGVFVGPVIHEQAHARFASAAQAARRDGRVRLGGESLRAGELAHGWFVAPTIVDALPSGHALLREELFLPFLCVETDASLEAALSLANATEYGLTAGLFSRDEREVHEFLDGIEAGVVFAKTQGGHGSESRTDVIMKEIMTYGSAARGVLPELKELIVSLNEQCQKGEFPAGELNNRRVTAVDEAIKFGMSPSSGGPSQQPRRWRRGTCAPG